MADQHESIQKRTARADVADLFEGNVDVGGCALAKGPTSTQRKLLPAGWANPQRIFDVLLGLSVLGWGVAGLVQSEPVERLALSHLTRAVLHGVVGIFLLLRDTPSRNGSPAAVALSLPTLLLAGLVWRIAPPGHLWPQPAAIVFAVAGAWAIAGLLCLGRSFAIFPSVRALVRRGPYSLVRHPMYLGEWAMVGAAAWAGSPLWGIAATVAMVPLLVIRIEAEERLLLGAMPKYRAYRRRVRWRLIPGLW